MPSYETIDAIADAYNPALFLAYMIFAVIWWKQGDRLAVLKGIAGLSVAYGLMVVDGQMRIWEGLGLDYSTHTAVALALVIFHLHNRSWRSAAALLISMSLLVYFAVMVYQKYHTLTDILTTAIVVGPVTVILYALAGRAYRSQPLNGGRA